MRIRSSLPLLTLAISMTWPACAIPTTTKHDMAPPGGSKGYVEFYLVGSKSIAQVFRLGADDRGESMGILRNAPLQNNRVRVAEHAGGYTYSVLPLELMTGGHWTGEALNVDVNIFVGMITPVRVEVVNMGGGLASLRLIVEQQIAVGH